MASVDAAAVKKLREMTNAGIMDCKSALTEAEGDFDKAAKILREKGIASASKKADREAADGRIEVYMHSDKKQAALIEINCETDFVAKNDLFEALCRDLAMQVVALKASYVRREEVPESVVEGEKHIYRQQAAGEGKPEAMLDKIAEGRLNKFYSVECLMEQEFIKDLQEKKPRTVDQVVKEAMATLGENIRVARFTRFKVGEQ